MQVEPEEDGIRLDRWFRRRWPHLSVVQIQKLVRSGQIRVDGARARPEARLASGATIRVPPLPDASPSGPGPAPLSDADVAYAKSLVLHEDDHVIALNKPPGLAVQGGTKTQRHVDRLLWAWGEGAARPRLVHRLDRDTSGVLLLGKGPDAARRLAEAFARRRALKTYWALVAGTPRPSSGEIDLPLKKTGIADFEMMRPADASDARAEAARTGYVTLRQASNRVAWMALRPHTGRTHQLRAHMAAIGHPILGDSKYGDGVSRSMSGDLKLQLHARRIELDHPWRGVLTVEAPLSRVFEQGLARFGFAETDAMVDPFHDHG